MTYLMSHILYFLFILLILVPHSVYAERGGGRWHLLQRSIGISAMHMQLLHDDRVVIFDRTDFGPSNLPLANGHCRSDPRDQALQNDCTAHAADYNSLTNTFRPLTVLTDTWCSSGATTPNGTLVQTGGFNDGELVVRTFQPSCRTCDWVELPNTLLEPRWYATNHVLPDGTSIIIGGRRSFSYEFYPKTTPLTSQLYKLPFLSQTHDPKEENNLYPFVFLNVDGNLFIFANNRAILFNYTSNEVVRTYPTIPGGEPRSYPNTGSAVLLPLKNLELGLNMQVEVLVCGGSPRGSYLRALNNNHFSRALNTCARIKISDPKPTWVIETMPMARVLGDMLLLPQGDVIIINGAGSGSAGWDLARDPVLNPVIYHTDNPPESRFKVQRPTTIPRMYHSSAILLRDGRVVVGGSNPHRTYNFSNNVLFPTELSLQAFSPQYLDPSRDRIRPRISNIPNSGFKVRYGQVLEVRFHVNDLSNPGSIKITMLRPPFNTHSFSMSQRLLVLTNTKRVKARGPGQGQYQISVMTPASANIAPPGYYMLYVVHNGVPSNGAWIQLT